MFQMQMQLQLQAGFQVSCTHLGLNFMLPRADAAARDIGQLMSITGEFVITSSGFL
ncbi:hypothetical protein E4U58_003904 [Claviceps cyperi]|nr:hypothetical protein E4U58_003904 [Claviceps cyperi]